MQPEYKIVSATGTYAATGTLAGSAKGWAAAIATYKILVPRVSSINRAGANPTDGPADFTVTFSEGVTGVNSADFAVTTVAGSATGSVSSVTQVNPSTYTVTVGNVAGSGTFRLDVVDNDSIKRFTNVPLGGTGTGNGSYAAGEIYTVLGSQATVTATAPSSATYGQTGVTATAAGGSGSGAYSFSAGLSTACLVSASTGAITITAASGTCAITATRAADNNYDVSSPSVPANITVGAAAVTVTFTADDKTYDGTDSANVSNCFIASGRIGSDDLTCSVSAGTFVSPNASASTQTVSATATLGGAAAANYTVANPVTTTATISAKAAVVTADDQTTTSGSGDPAFTFHVSSLESGDSLTGVSCDVSGAHTDAGTYTISCAGNTNTNYAASYFDGTLTVIPAGPAEQSE